tara:strand:+ start:109 stop:549 length:441 start_codon:yes stop_codon:yes gene_type:complete
MKILPAKGKTSKKRKNEKLFGASKLRRIKTSWKEKATKERVIKFVGKPSEESKFILSLREKKTSPKTLELQKAKTAKFTVELVHDCIAEGTYSNLERQEMKRERLHEMKPKRKARWEQSLIVPKPPTYKMKKGKLKIVKRKKRLDI